jgi:hypothetical protein
MPIQNSCAGIPATHGSLQKPYLQADRAGLVAAAHAQPGGQVQVRVLVVTLPAGGVVLQAAI